MFAESLELINYTETYRAKFAKVCIRSRAKTIFAGKLFGNNVVPVLYENNHSLSDYANELSCTNTVQNAIGSHC